MRHASLDFSAKQYADSAGFGFRETADRLPAFPVGGQTQIRAQISAVEGQNVSQAGETQKRKVTSQSLIDKCLSRLESGVFAVGRMVRAAGFEPATPSV